MHENVHIHQYITAQLDKAVQRERVTKLYWLILSKLVYWWYSVPCTLVLECCMMLCKMSLDRHLCCQGFFDAILTVYLGMVKMDEKHSKFVNTAQIFWHVFSYPFRKNLPIAQNERLCASPTSFEIMQIPWISSEEPLNLSVSSKNTYPLDLSLAYVFLTGYDTLIKRAYVKKSDAVKYRKKLSRPPFRLRYCVNTH